MQWLRWDMEMRADTNIGCCKIHGVLVAGVLMDMAKLSGGKTWLALKKLHIGSRHGCQVGNSRSVQMASRRAYPRGGETSRAKWHREEDMGIYVNMGNLVTL